MASMPQLGPILEIIGWAFGRSTLKISYSLDSENLWSLIVKSYFAPDLTVNAR